MKYIFKEGKGLQDIINIYGKYELSLYEIEVKLLYKKDYTVYITHVKNVFDNLFVREILDLFQEVIDEKDLIGELGVFSDIEIDRNAQCYFGVLQAISSEGYYFDQSGVMYECFMPITEYQKLLKGKK
jgi:hypothetical protein